jgi:hypothetical protein
MPNEDRVRGIAEDIQTYFAGRPEAWDSADGILRWWLPRVRLEESMRDLQQALDDLVERGIVVRREVAGGRVVYGRAPHTAEPRPPHAQI